MKPHEERVVAEKTELDAKIDKLVAFSKSETFTNSVDGAEQERLGRQLAIMLEYTGVLAERIAHFPK